MVDIEKIEKRTFQSFYDDGLGRDHARVLPLSVRRRLICPDCRPRKISDLSALGLLSIIIVLSAGLLTGRIVSFLKRRITYPRTGYVAFKNEANRAEAPRRGRHRRRDHRRVDRRALRTFAFGQRALPRCERAPFGGSRLLLRPQGRPHSFLRPGRRVGGHRYRRRRGRHRRDQGHRLLLHAVRRLAHPLRPGRSHRLPQAIPSPRR